MNLCPICNADASLKYTLTYDVYHCKKCDFQFAPNARFNTSLVSDLDESSRIKALKNLRMLNFERIMLSLKKYITPSNTGLEIGCGHGWFLEACKANQIKCIGIEPETHFNDLHKSIGVEVLNGFFPDVLPANTQYDFIAYNDVFEHLPDVKAMMKTNNGLLNKNGKLIINLPIQGGVTYFISGLAYYFGVKTLINRMWQFNFHSPHFSYFSKKNLTELAGSADFKLIDSFPLKTINISEIKDRVNQDKNSNVISRYISIAGAFALYPFMQLFPDTYCFVFEKKS